MCLKSWTHEREGGGAATGQGREGWKQAGRLVLLIYSEQKCWQQYSCCSCTSSSSTSSFSIINKTSLPRRAALFPWSQISSLILRPPIRRTTPSPSSPSALHPHASTSRFNSAAAIIVTIIGYSQPSSRSRTRCPPLHPPRPPPSPVPSCPADHTPSRPYIPES